MDREEGGVLFTCDFPLDLAANFTAWEIAGTRVDWRHAVIGMDVDVSIAAAHCSDSVR